MRPLVQNLAGLASVAYRIHSLHEVEFATPHPDPGPMPAWGVLLLGVVLTLVISGQLRQQARDIDWCVSIGRCSSTMRAIMDGLQKCQMAASSLADFFEARDSITRPEWQFRIRMLISEQNHPGMPQAGFAEIKDQLPEAVSTNSGVASTRAASPTTGQFHVRHAWARPPSAMQWR